MGRRKQDDLEKVTLNLTAGDKAVLEKFFPAMGWSVAARKIINQTCRRLKERESQALTEEAKINDSIPDIR